MGLAIGVLSACSSNKVVPEEDIELGCLKIDQRTQGELRNAYPSHVFPAQDLYTGDEHSEVEVAISQLRALAEVEWRILSAGFGLVEESTPLPAYNCTFKNDDAVRTRLAERDIDPESLTKRQRLATLGHELGIPSDIKAWLRDGEFDMVLVLLGKEYLSATGDALDHIPAETQAYAFAPRGSRELIGECGWVPSVESDRAAFGTTHMELKGKQLRALAENLTSSDELAAIQSAEELHERSLPEQP